MGVKSRKGEKGVDGDGNKRIPAGQSNADRRFGAEFDAPFPIIVELQPGAVVEKRTRFGKIIERGTAVAQKFLPKGGKAHPSDGGESGGTHSRVRENNARRPNVELATQMKPQIVQFADVRVGVVGF